MNKSKLWHEIDWKQANEKVFKIQEEIVTAYREGDLQKVYRKQRTLVTTWDAACIAVRTVYTNSGGKSPGLDGIVWKTPAQRMEAIEEIKRIVNNLKDYNPSPVKRVMIPKANNPSEMRPLGIPTMIDRAIQKLYAMALDPVLEELSDPGSFGFRKGRSTLDAIERTMSLLITRYNSKWVLECDIEKCFDKISHEFLMNNTVLCDKFIVKKWLEAGHIFNKTYTPTNQGTPQGGIISPLLCNLALNGLEKAIKETVADKKYRNVATSTPKVSVVRYADDLIVTGRSEELLTTIVKPVIENFLKERGLNLKESKTRVVRIDTGFDFLGYHFRQFKQNYKLNKLNKEREDVLVVKIANKNIKKIVKAIKAEIIKQKPLGAIIRSLNPKLRGWANYFRVTQASVIQLAKIHQYLWVKLKNWARKRHPKWGFKKIAKTYLPNFNLKRNENSRWDWGVNSQQVIFNLAKVTKWTPAKLKLYPHQNPYTLEGSKYLENRKISVYDTKYKVAILKKYNYICEVCGQSLLNNEAYEFHHLKPRIKGGTWKIENIQPLHRICHQKVTFQKKDK